MSASLKLISLNVQVSEHVEPITSFLRAQQPDVVCLQEACPEDVSTFADAFGAECVHFVPMTNEKRNAHRYTVGLAVLAKSPASFETRYYAGPVGSVPETDANDSKTYTQKAHMVLSIDTVFGGEQFHIATTHFTWSAGGRPTDLQREHMRSLISVLRGEELVLCGDFNAPRGGEIWGMLAARYTDNVPPEYKTSIDIELHRAGKTRPEELSSRMVDGIFSTASYEVSDVRMTCGVSDHCALTAVVTKYR